jgi:hypothetical protein
VIIAAQSEFGFVLQNDEIIAVKKRIQFLDAVNIYKARTMDSQKLFGIEFGFRVVHRFPKQMRVFTDMEFDVISGGFDPINIRSFDKINPSGGF